MSLFSTIPRETTVSFKKGMPPHLGVYALQCALNAIFTGDRLDLDGSFGDVTERRLKRYQGNVKLAADGVFGPLTQKVLALSMRKHTDPDERVPKGIIDGLVSGESGGFIDAKNWTVKGGVDLSYVQRRVVFPIQSEIAVRRAYDPTYQFGLVTDSIVDDHVYYLTYPSVKKREDHWEYAWRLAVLEHNWPFAAHELAKGEQLSSQRATWVPAGVKFADGAAVVTFADWARFYAMGSHRHNHKGFMVSQAFGVPKDG